MYSLLLRNQKVEKYFRIFQKIQDYITNVLIRIYIISYMVSNNYLAMYSNIVITINSGYIRITQLHTTSKLMTFNNNYVTSNNTHNM